MASATATSFTTATASGGLDDFKAPPTSDIPFTIKFTDSTGKQTSVEVHPRFFPSIPPEEREYL